MPGLQDAVILAGEGDEAFGIFRQFLPADRALGFGFREVSPP